MTQAVWSASLKDDISAVAAKMSANLVGLDKKASDLFKSSSGNFKDFRKGLRDSGVAALDTTLVVNKYRAALTSARKEALGLSATVSKATPEMRKFADSWVQIGLAAQKAQFKAQQAAIKSQERAAKSTTWSRAKSAFSQAVSPSEIAVGFARGVGDRVAGLPGQALSGMLGVVSTIGEKVSDVGRGLVESVIDAAQFRQNAITGLEYMLGTRKEAEQVFADAQKLAQDTPLDTDKVISGIKQLVTGGFNAKESMLLFKAVADQASKFAGVEGMQENVIAAFSRVKGRGVANAEDLDSFRKAGFRVEGIVQSLLEKENLAPLFKKIKMPGLAGGKTRYVDQSDADKEAIQKQVGEILGQGRVGSTTFLNAALASLERDKPDVGEFAKKMGKVSLTGTISNFKSSFKDLLQSVNLDEWEGVKQFQEFLTRITTMMQGDVGKGLLATIERVINAVLGGLANIKDSDIKSFVETVGVLGEKAVGFIKDAWKWLDDLLHAEPGTLVDSIGDALIDIGKHIGAGLWEGVKAAASGAFGKEKSEKFEKSYGVRLEDVEAVAGKLGISNKDAFAAFKGGAAARQKAGFKAPDFSGDWTDFGAVDYIKTVVEEQRRRDALAAFEKMEAVGRDAAAGMEQGARAELDSHSPSRTMARVGEDAAAGLVAGTKEGVAKGGAGARGIGTLAVNVNVGSVSGGSADAVGQAIADITIERIVTALFERRALEG